MGVAAGTFGGTLVVDSSVGMESSSSSSSGVVKSGRPSSPSSPNSARMSSVDDSASVDAATTGSAISVVDVAADVTVDDSMIGVAASSCSEATDDGCGFSTAEKPIFAAASLAAFNSSINRAHSAACGPGLWDRTLAITRSNAKDTVSASVSFSEMPSKSG